MEARRCLSSMCWRLCVGCCLWAWASAFAAALTSPPNGLPYRSAAVTPDTDVDPLSEDAVRQSTADDTTSKLPEETSGDNGGIDDLLAWASTYAQNHRSHHMSWPPSPPAQTCARANDCFLVVSVKTRVVDGFQNRQAIRATWADPHITRPLHTRVVFLACEPDPSKVADMNATLDALALEKQVYGDLLTHELGGCVDSYFKLVDKIVGFFHWVGTHHATAAYVMMADDDVYTRLDRIVAMLRDEATPRTRYYAGQVSYVQLGRFIETIRDKSRKNYVSEHDYPFSVHVPRAIGAHYLLSMDLVQFIAQNQQDLRGAGAIEDLSVGLWLRALLQVHPVHLHDFDTAGVNICRNSLVSYGDLAPVAIRQIHKNLMHEDPLCRGFLWGSWINEGAKEPVQAVIAPQDAFHYGWDFHIEGLTRAIRIVITVRLPSRTLTLPPVSYMPSMVSPFYFCDRVYEKLSRPLPALRCDYLLDQLAKFLEETPPPLNAALYAITKSNLPPVAGPSVEVDVWLSTTVLRWRAVIESLMAEMYPDFQVFVVDEHAYSNPTTLSTLTLVVVSAEALERLPGLPKSCRVIVFGTRPAPSTLPNAAQHGVIWLTHAQSSTQSHTPSPVPEIYLPPASLVFSDSLECSPIALLDFSSKRKPEFFPIQPFAVPRCTLRVAAFLETIQAVPTQELVCTAEKARSIGRQDYDQEQALGISTPETIFAFDTDVVRYTQAKFVLAFESLQPKSPGYIGGSIAAAFVAGSVPIYDGDDATVSRLFNPKAFISCGRFASLRECGEFVGEVNRSAVLYEAMRNEPPVVNETAFYEVFSWHPDVRQRLKARLDTEGREWNGRDVDMVERLRDMINRV